MTHWLLDCGKMAWVAVVDKVKLAHLPLYYQNWVMVIHITLAMLCYAIESELTGQLVGLLVNRILQTQSYAEASKCTAIYVRVR